MNAQPNSGAVVLSDDLKSPAMEKLDLVRKWSINTYKVILFVLDFFLRPSSTVLLLSVLVFVFSHLIRLLAEKWTILQTDFKSLLSSAVYQADPVREAGSGVEDRGPGAGGPNRSPARQQEKVPECNQAGSDAGQSAVPDHADTEAAGRRLRRPQPQVTRTACESIEI